jgi:transcription elongation factor
MMVTVDGSTFCATHANASCNASATRNASFGGEVTVGVDGFVCAVKLDGNGDSHRLTKTPTTNAISIVNASTVICWRGVDIHWRIVVTLLSERLAIRLLRPSLQSAGL